MAKQKYLSLSEIAPQTPYSAEYLSLLARRGKLRCVKVENVWHTTEQWVGEYLESARVLTAPAKEQSSQDLMSVTEIAGATSYGAEYLSLRIRQGKIKGQKIGRQWYTKKEWIDEYVAGLKTSVEPPAVPMAPSANVDVGNLVGNIVGDLVPRIVDSMVERIEQGIEARLNAKSFELPVSSFQTEKSGPIHENAKVQIPNAKSILKSKFQNIILGLKSFDLHLNFDSLTFGISHYLRSLKTSTAKLIPHPSHPSAFSSHSLTRLLSASLVITILVVFVAPAKTWVHYGLSYGAQMKKVITLSAQTVNTLSQATAKSLDQLALGIKSFDLDLLARRIGGNFDSLEFDINAPRVAGETIERSVTAPSPAGESRPALRSLGVGGGEGLKKLGSRLLLPLYSAFSFLDPSSLSSLISRLSGSVIEAGQSLSTSIQKCLPAFGGGTRPQ